MRPYRLIRHAAEMLDERGIERAWLEAALTEPDRQDTDPRYPARIRHWKKIAANGDRWLRVVYEIVDKELVVITVFFDRNEGRRA